MAETDPKPEKTYRVVCISLYNSDIDAIDAKVRELKALGWKAANRSHLIRIALSQLTAQHCKKIVELKLAQQSSGVDLDIPADEVIT